MSNYNKILILLILLIYQNYGYTKSSKNDTLVMVNIIFRHGDRTTEELTLYPNDPHINETYYPLGLGQLTNAGKRRMFNLGKEIRKRYRYFLNDIYTPESIRAISSDFDRTKASLLLVLAGLFPPSNRLIWDETLNWQPIPFNYLEKETDMTFLAFFQPKFQKSLRQHLSSEEYLNSMKNHTDLMKYLETHSGGPVQNFLDIAILTFCLVSEEEMGLHLPSWTKSVYPYPLKDLASNVFIDLSGTPELIRLCAGHMLKSILEEVRNKIDGKLPTERKLYLLSGHDINCACMLRLLDIFQIHSPPYGSYVIFELHNIKDVYGFKIYYQDYSSQTPKLQNLPNCGTFCELDTFIKLYEKYLPE